jgi:hypothetical protein
MDAFCSQYVQNKKMKTIFIFERAPLNLKMAIKLREREREEEGFFLWADLLADQRQIQEVGSS